MVEVFATNIEEVADARRIASLLNRHFPGHRINFDLQDCDRILRVEGKQVTPGQVVRLVKQNGFECSVLE